MRRSTAYLLFVSLVAAFLPGVRAQETNRAALVVVFGDGEMVTRCVEFDEPQLSSFELLNRSGLVVEAGGGNLGTAVCRIQETGCPASNCFCQCAGATCQYWSYWHLLDGAWRYSQVGAGAFQVGDGAVEGWSWGPGSPDQAPEPPLVSFDDVCAPLPAGQELEAAGATDTPVALATTGQQSEAATAGPNANVPGGQWLAYGLLGLVVVGLVAALLLAQRRSIGR